VTGVYFQIIPDNTSKPVRIDSDKQYGLGSDLIQKFLSVGYQVEKSFTTFNTEYEFSNDYIVQTIKAVDSLPSDQEKWITRMVYQGDFRYKKGFITSASINLIAQSWDDNGLGGTMWRFPKAVRIKKPNSLFSWAKALDGNWHDKWNTDGYSSEPFWNDAYTAVMRMDGGKKIWETGGGKRAFQTLGSGQFFQDGWWTNPFDSNLI